MYSSKNSEYVCNHIKKRKKDLVRVLGGRCCLCGFNSFTEALEFHHVNPKEKSFGIGASNAITKSLEAQLEELKKCILVCANCHRGIHNGILESPDNPMLFYNKEVAAELLQEKQDIIQKKKHYCTRCGKLIESREAKYCDDCRIIVTRMVDRPSREELKDLIRTKPFVQIGRQFGVSDNAIKKWCKTYNLPFRKIDIKEISDEDWEKI